VFIKIFFLPLKLLLAEAIGCKSDEVVKKGKKVDVLFCWRCYPMFFWLFELETDLVGCMEGIKNFLSDYSKTI
jgi:hypothetical protein